MADFTSYAQENLANYILAGTAISFSTAWFVSLHTADPSSAGTSNEVSTGVWTNYARAQVDRTTDGWTDAASTTTGYRTANSSTVDFGTATLSSDYTVTHFAIRNSSDSTSAGNAWFYGALTAQKTIQNGDPVTFPTTSLGITLS